MRKQKRGGWPSGRQKSGNGIGIWARSPAQSYGESCPFIGQKQCGFPRVSSCGQPLGAERPRDSSALRRVRMRGLGPSRTSEPPDEPVSVGLGVTGGRLDAVRQKEGRAHRLGGTAVCAPERERAGRGLLAGLPDLPSWANTDPPLSHTQGSCRLWRDRPGQQEKSECSLPPSSLLMQFAT